MINQMIQEDYLSYIIRAENKISFLKDKITENLYKINELNQ